MRGRRIPAVYMRGGTSKGVFFHERDLPGPGPERDQLLARIIGSPDPWRRHTDGMGGATSSTSKAVIIAPSARDDCDVDYTFGAVAIDRPLVDWSGNCGNLSAAVGPFAISEGLVPAQDGQTRVRIWQCNLGLRIDALVPVCDGEVVEDGRFAEDGVPFPGAAVRLEYHEPAPAPGTLPLLPTGRVQDWLEVPGVGRLAVTLVTAGNPTVFFRADALGLTGRELPADVDGDAALLERLEAIRAHGCVAMGLAATPAEASERRPATPKVSWLAPPAAYRTSAGAEVGAGQVDVLARIMSMGRLHHAYTGTGSIALAAATALPGSVAAELAGPAAGPTTRIGHVSGVVAVGADVLCDNGTWRMRRALMERSARRLMSGWVHVPPAAA